MREPFLKLLLGYLDQLIEAVSGIELYSDVVKDIEKQKEAVLPAYNEYKRQIEDKEVWKTLSMQEQSAVGQNEINFRNLLREMDESISHLSKQRWTRDVTITLSYLDDSKLAIEDLLTSNDLIDVGQEVKLKNLIGEKFGGMDYTGKTAHMQTVIDLVRETIITSESLPPFHYEALKSNLGKSIQLLQRDITYTEDNGMPELFQYNIPEVVVSEVPDYVNEDAPEEKSEYPGTAEANAVIEAHDAQVEETQPKPKLEVVK